jgi:hypothetical protein
MAENASENKLTYKAEEFDFNDSVKISEAIDLLKTVFPATDFFTEEWFDWKYKRNPFGNPLGWYATYQGQMVGIRLCTPNRFRLGDETFNAYQMVDTATHPGHLRRGIFSSLTKKAIEKVVEEEGRFFFNFPNSNSLPGNLSLGWKIVEKKEWILSLTSPFSFFRKFKENEFKVPVITTKKHKDNLCTDWSKESLRWRFKDHPYNRYSIFCVDDREFIIYKVRKIRGFLAAMVMLVQADDYKRCLKKFNKHLGQQGVPFILYNGMNEEVRQLLTTSFFKTRSERKVNFVVKNFPDSLHQKLLLELADTDYH